METTLDELLAQQQAALEKIAALRQTLADLPSDILAEMETALGKGGTVEKTQMQVKRIRGQMRSIDERMQKIESKSLQLAARHAKALEEEQSKEEKLRAKEAK